MKTIRKSRKNSFIKIAIVAIILLVVGLIGFGLTRRYESPQTNTNNQSEKTENSIKSDPPAPIGDSGDSENIRPPFTVSIVSVTQSNGYLDVTSKINTDVSGTCNYTFFTKDARPITRSFESNKDMSEQICKVSIPEVEFEKIGTWRISIRYSTENSSAEVYQNVEIR